jgi:hypothetical protein
MNMAIIDEESLLYLEGREKPIDAAWFANSARIKRIADVTGVIVDDAGVTVWPFGGGIGWKPEPPERWTIVDAGADSRSTSRRYHVPGRRPARNWQEYVLRAIIRALYNNRPIPSGSELAAACLEDLKLLPDVSAINKLKAEVLVED